MKKFLLFLLIALAATTQAYAVGEQPYDTVWKKDFKCIMNRVYLTPDGSKIYVLLWPYVKSFLEGTDAVPVEIDSKDGSVIKNIEALRHSQQLEMSYDGKLLIASNRDTIKVWDTESEEIVKTFLSPFENDSTILSIELSQDKKYLAAVISHRIIGETYTLQQDTIWMHDLVVWDFDSQQILFQKQVPKGKTLAISPDSKYLALGYYRQIPPKYIKKDSSEVEIYQIDTWDLYFNYKTKSVVNDLEFSSDNKYLAIATSIGNYLVPPNGDILLLDIQNKSFNFQIEEAHDAAGDPAHPTKLLFYNNQYLFSAGDFSHLSARFWDIKKKDTKYIREYHHFLTSLCGDKTAFSFISFNKNKDLMAFLAVNYLILINISNDIPSSVVEEEINAKELNSNNEIKELRIAPNPVTGECKISFELENHGHTLIKIFDFNGSEIAAIFNGILPSGANTVNWYPGNLADGIYFCRITSNNQSSTIKLILER